MKLRALAVLTPAVAALAFAIPAAAATSESSSEAVSENWAGYEATTQSGSDFSAVSGSWVVPTVSASSGPSYSAYWVGLGGGDRNSQALEQEGTQADVSANGRVSYYAWYELVPAAPVRIPMTVKPGDTMYARTAVAGNKVTVTVDDRTSGKSFTKTLTMKDPDTSTAEWVAEAPSQCQGGATGNCTVLPLADFGTVKFTNALARSNGTVKSISGWNSQAIAMSPASSASEFGYGDGYGGGFGGPDAGTSSASSSAGAAPGALSANGTAFSVTYGANSAVTSGSSASGYGVTSSSGYGSSGYGASGYGSSGYGASGYGSSGYGGYGYGGYGYGSSGDGDAGYGGYGSYGYGYGDSGYGYGDSASATTGSADGYGYTSAGSPYVLVTPAGYSEAYYGSANSITGLLGL